MAYVRRPWQEELEIIDRTMKAISGVTDPQELVDVYWDGIGELVQVGDYVSLSRRNVEPPGYLITRSSRFTEEFNPWTQRDRLPRLAGGLLGELAYANKPVIIWTSRHASGMTTRAIFTSKASSASSRCRSTTAARG